MTGLTGSQLADQLGITRGRVSQMVTDGKLNGCYSGEGRGRRFDLAAVAATLGRRLDPGQMMGNGAGTRKALASIAATAGDDAEDRPAPRPVPARDTLAPQDPDRYELARIDKVEQEARKLRRQNAEAEGQYVLASEVERQVAQQLAQEVREVETMLRTGARALADRLGVDFAQARAVLIETWRAHRGDRANVAQNVADAAIRTDAERAADI